MEAVENDQLKSPGFDIQILHLNWVKHLDDPTDLCAHGSVFVKIADTIMVDEKEGDGWTLSAAALNLMRTLERDYKPGDFAGQLIPCCGFFLLADDENDKVDICGCASGFDWTIKHEGQFVRHLTDSSDQAIIDKKLYQHLVLSFADKVKQFYEHSTPKILPADEFARKGYKAFWKEWNYLRSRWAEGG